MLMHSRGVLSTVGGFTDPLGAPPLMRRALSTLISWTKHVLTQVYAHNGNVLDIQIQGHHHRLVS